MMINTTRSASRFMQQVCLPTFIIRSLSSNQSSLQQRIAELEQKVENEGGLKSSPVIAQTHQRYSGRKRFYKKVGVDTIKDSSSGADVHRVLLDGRVLKTPGRNPLYLPSYDLAMIVAGEWDAQTDVRTGIEPVTMPVMTLVSTAIDQIQNNEIESDSSTSQKQIVVENCMKYLPTDSLLFFTKDFDRILLTKQRKHLSPIIKALNRQLSLQLNSTTEVTTKLQHSKDTIEKIRQILEKMDHFSLACVQAITMECKSILLALAYFGKLIDTEQLIAASRIEEEFQVEIWGVVEGGHDMDRLNHSVALHSAALVLNLLYSEQDQRRSSFLALSPTEK